MKKVILTVIAITLISLSGYSKEIFTIVKTVKGAYELRATVQSIHKTNPSATLEIHCIKYDEKNLKHTYLILRKEIKKSK